MLNRSEFDFRRLSEGRYIMGILNVTPDSFSDGGRFLSHDQAYDQACRMIEEGADIIDIGGESTRPGSDPVPENLEMDRILPLIGRLAKNTDILISADTSKSAVAREAIRAGAGIINDISGLTADPRMVSIAAELNVPVVIMHIRGTPKNMQVNPVYQDAVAEVKNELQERIRAARSAGIRDIIIDPGFGFGKRLEDNFRLLYHLNEFLFPGCPLMVGTSRKSFLGSMFGAPPDDRVEGTLVTNAWACMKGANLFRVHDVRAVSRAVQMIRTILEAS